MDRFGVFRPINMVPVFGRAPAGRIITYADWKRSEDEPCRGLAKMEREARPCQSAGLHREASARSIGVCCCPEAITRWMGDSLHLRTEGVDLAFQVGETVIGPGAHHGFVVDSAANVEAIADTLRREGITMSEDYSDNDLRSINFHDPDGYECEVYWEGTWP